MFEELFELVLGPIGLVAAAAAMLVGSEKGRDVIRTATREVVKGGLVAQEKMADMAARAQAELSDLVYEAQSELKDGKKHESSH